MIAYIKKLFQFLLDWKENREIVRWLIALGRNYKRYVFIFLVINLITMLISFASAVAGRYVVDAATGYRSDLFFNYIWFMLGATVVSILISAGAGLFSGYIHERFSFEIRAKMYDRVQRGSWFQLMKYHSGDLMTRLSGDIDSIASTLISIVPSTVVTACQLILVLFVLLKYDPTLAVIGLIIGPIGMIAVILSRKKFSEYQQKLRESQSEYHSFLQESLAGIGVVKAFQLENHNNRRFADIRGKRMKLIMKSAVLSNVMGSAMRMVYSIGYVIAFSWCAYRLTASAAAAAVGDAPTYTYGTMTLFLSLVSQVQGTIRSLGGLFPKFYSVVISAKRVREITELDTEDVPTCTQIPSAVGLRADHVSFSYEREKGEVLRNLTFDVPAGSRVGIVGSSGAGKTTFIRLLLAFLKPDAGTLSYLTEDGNAECVTPESRRFIAYVPQGNTLMSGSVRSNLLAGNPEADDAAMWAVLEMADAAEFLRKMPDGLDTVLGEGAGGMSEGQAQRVAIARALLRNKPVLILDEATSALDEDTERRIFERICSGSDKTCFIITHRRSMLRYCDKILEIDSDGSAAFTDFWTDDVENASDHTVANA